MDTIDLLRLVHPALAVIWVFPVIGMTSYFAWQTRQRRQAAIAKQKTKIPPVVGLEHVKVGRWLAASVVGLALIGLAHPITKKLISNQVWAYNPYRVVFIGLMFVFTIASLVMLYRAKPALWRGIFAALSSMGLIILGSQPEVFRRGYELLVSHYYYGMGASLLMIVSVAVLPEIYRSPAWRRAHIFLNTVALLLFIGQGMTGARDLLEIPLSWQEPFIFGCDFVNKTCQ